MFKLIIFKSHLKKLLLVTLMIAFSFTSNWTYQADVLNAKNTSNGDLKELTGNVIIEKDSTTLMTQRALIFSNNEKFQLFGDIKMIDNNNVLTCDTLFYFSNDVENIIAFGNVNFENDNTVIESDSLYYSMENDSISAFGNAFLNHLESTMTADLINLTESKGFLGNSFHAQNNVVINDNEVTIKGSEVFYIDSIQHMTILEDAHIIDTNNEILGENIFIQFQDSMIQQILIDDNPIINRKITNTSYESNTYNNLIDIISGESMVIDYINNKLDKVHVIGMASSLYHVIDDSLLEGINEVSGDSIVFLFRNEELSKIKVSGGGKGFYTPEFENSNIDSIINYFAEKIDYDVANNINRFYQSGSIQYQDTKLNADYMEIDWDTNKLNSYKVNDTQPIVQTDKKSSPMLGDTIYFDLISKIGMINKGRTELNNAFYHGHEIVHDNKNNIYSSQGIYTSCDLDHPHYYFKSHKMKMIPDKYIIAQPIILHIKGLPIIGFPFAILPNKGGQRQSGWIMPTFGYSERNGTYFHNLGYYHVLNDYSEIKVLSNFYDRKGFKLNFKFRYNKRYNYSGNFSSTLVQDLNSGSSDIKNIFSNATQNNNLIWSHNHQIDPTQNYNFNFHYISKNDFYQQSQVGYNSETRLQQNILSTFNYRKSWSNSDNSININLSDSFNPLIKNNNPTSSVPVFYRNMILPQIKFNHGSRLLFGDGTKWYHSIYYGYNSDYKASRDIGHLLLENNEVKDSIRYKNGINHRFYLKGSKKLFKHINFNTTINMLESWILGYKEPQLDSNGLFIDNKFDSSDKFKRRLTGDLSLSMRTKLYGVLSTNIFNLTAIRHVISPSVSYSYRPDFSQQNISGLNIDYVTTDSSGDVYDYFSGNLVPSTPLGKRESYAFKLNNDFYGKIFTNGEYKKIHLINWSNSLSYNPTYEEFQLSYLNSSIRSTLSSNLNFNINFTYDLYKTSNGIRINEIANSPRLSSVNSSVQFKLFGKQIDRFQQTSLDSMEDDTNSNIYDQYEPILTSNNKWQATFNLGSFFNFNNSLNQWDKDFWFDSNLDFNITKHWSLSYSARFNVISSEIVRHNLMISRPLHCWMFSFQWYPGIGPNNFGSGFQLLIKVKNPDLQDIRLKHTEGNMFGF